MTSITVQCARLRAQLSRHLVAASIVVGAAGMSACASGGGVGMRAAQYDASPTSVVIENNSWDRVTVYISRGDQLWRLGDVGALARTEFPIQRLGFIADGRSTFLVAPQFASTMFRRISTRSLGGSVDAGHDFDRVTLRGGIEGGRDTLDGDYAPVSGGGVTGAVVATEDVARTRKAAFATATFRIAPRVQFIAGVRRDSIDSTSATSPRLGLNVHLGDVVFFAQASRAFKAPTLDQLFDPRPFPGPTGKPIFISNSSLQPQHAQNFELGASRTTSSLNWSIAAYTMRVHDEIDLDLRTFSYRNIGASRHHGVEASGELTLARVQPFVTYAWTHVEDEANPGQQLKNIPEHVAQLGLTTTLPGRVDASVVWRWMHGRWLDDDGLFPMPDVSRVDLRLGRRFGPASVQLDVLNATNVRYNELGYVLFGTPLEYPAAGRAFRVGATWRF